MGIEAYMKVRCTDTAVYWSSPVSNAGGTMTFAAPVEISCLWTGKRELYRDDEGREVACKATVYLLQELDDHGMVYKGELVDLSAGEKSDPRIVNDAREIKLFIKTPSLNTVGQFNRKVLL